MPFKLFSRTKTRDADYDYEHYEEDASFQMEINDLVEEIQSGRKKILTTNDYLTPESFLEKDLNGVTLLETVCKHGVILDDSLERRIVNDEDIIEFCLQHPKTIFNKFIVQKMNTVYRLKGTISKETLFKIYSNGISLIEYIIKNGYIGLYVLSGIDDIRVYDLLLKYGRFDGLEYLNEELLFRPHGRFQSLFEQFLSENRVKPDMIKNFVAHTEACELCRKYNKMYLLKHAPARFLLYEFNDGTTVINHLIKGNNADSKTFERLGNTAEQRVVYSIIKFKAYRYLVFYTNVLFGPSSEDKNKTYLDLLLENYNESVDLYLAEINANILPVQQRAELYIKCAKKGLNTLLPELDEELLLTKVKEESFLDALLRMDKDIAITKVIPPGLRKKPGVAAIIYSKGSKVKDAYVPTDRDDEYLETKKELYSIKVSKKIEAKLLELRSLFLTDGESTEEEVNTLIASYRLLSKNNYRYLEKELDMLIKYKKANPGFKVLRTNKSAYFSPGDNSVNVTNSSISVFNHELGHALHHIGCNSFYPDNLEEVISRVRNSKGCLDRIQTFSKKMDALGAATDIEAEKIYEKKYGNYFDTNRREKIQALIDKESKAAYKRFKELGYDQDRIKKAMSELYNISEEEYIERFRKTRIREISCDIIWERYYVYQAISDIIDAVFTGRLRSGMCKNEKGEDVSLRFGHGINYYYKDGSVFNEMMADYSEIIKSEEGEEALAYLRSIVGNELVSLLEDFYERRVLHIENMSQSQKENAAYGR